MRAQNQGNLAKMKDIANIMTNFKGYSQCVDAFIETSQMVREVIQLFDCLICSLLISYQAFLLRAFQSVMKLVILLSFTCHTGFAAKQLKKKKLLYM